MTETEKMNAGLWYDANCDPALLEERKKAAARAFAFNQCNPEDEPRQKKLLAALFPEMDDSARILPPVYTDYGKNCRIMAGTFINHGAYLMDGASITIGRNCFIGPFCGFYTASHPLTASERNLGLEKALPITIGDNVWFGASVIVLPGVSVGSDSVIGAGSVITRDIPGGVLAAGNPCRVLRPLSQKDSIYKGPWEN